MPVIPGIGPAENLSLYNQREAKFRDFEIFFRNNEGTIVAHNFIVFQHCNSLLSLPTEGDRIYIFEDNTYEEFSNFIQLLYGRVLILPIRKIFLIYKLAKQLKYRDLTMFKNIIMDNIKDMKYTFAENEMSTLSEILNHEDFNINDIISKCKLSQLKRIAMITDNNLILRQIALETMTRYSNDTREMREYYEKRCVPKYEQAKALFENEEKTVSEGVREFLETKKKQEEENILKDFMDNNKDNYEKFKKDCVDNDTSIFKRFMKWNK